MPRITKIEIADQIYDVGNDISNLAPISSPAFSGTPTAPTPTAGDDSTKVATTEFVKSAIETAIADITDFDEVSF